ncbi:MAG: MFS transporter [Dehalococcoidia bacterium]
MTTTLSPRSVFAIPAYRRLWLAAVAIAFSMWLERLAVGWLVLDRTGSPLLAALTFAVRMAPNLVVGPFAGAVADRSNRARLIAATALSRAAVTAAIGLIVLVGADATWVVLLLVAAAGVARVFEMPAEQALIVDLVGGARSADAIALHSVGVRSVGLLGALAGALIIDYAGPAEAFAAGAVFLGAAAWLMSTITVEARLRVTPAASLWRDAVEGVRALVRIPTVAALLVFALLVEILAFAYNSLLPTVALLLLDAGATGLGLLTAAAGVGSVLGSLLLSLLRPSVPRGLVLLVATFAYGVLLVAFGASQQFLLSLVLVGGVGAAAAMFDALQWTLLQRHVPDEMRGRAIGGWVWAIGFGWVGPILLGAAAEALGVSQALAISGSLVVVLAIAAAALVPGLRRA